MSKRLHTCDLSDRIHTDVLGDDPQIGADVTQESLTFKGEARLVPFANQILRYPAEYRSAVCPRETARQGGHDWKFAYYRPGGYTAKYEVMTYYQPEVICGGGTSDETVDITNQSVIAATCDTWGIGSLLLEIRAALELLVVLHKKRAIKIKDLVGTVVPQGDIYEVIARLSRYDLIDVKGQKVTLTAKGGRILDGLGKEMGIAEG